MAHVWLWRAAVGIEEEELGETSGTVAADVEIIGAEGKMGISALDVAGPEGAGRIEGQIACRAPQASQAPAPLKGGRSIILRPNRF